MLGRLEQSSGRMAGMVDDLLAVAVSSQGQRSMLRPSPTSARSLLERAIEAVGPLFAREGIEMLVDSDAALPEVQVDADRMLRVFVNLLDNALKFTQRPGRVVLRARARPGAVRFSVANSGSPLPAEVHASMFLPFWQASEDLRGAGLGLSICRSIVEAHGGRIWAESEPGMCVRVCFEVPLASSSTPIPSSEAAVRTS
jgi:NtrC-family two-component system sensor histidine kinase KinB